MLKKYLPNKYYCFFIPVFTMIYIIHSRNHFPLGEFNVASVEIDAVKEKMQAFK